MTVNTQILTVEPVANMELVITPEHASVTDMTGVSVGVTMEKGTQVTLAVDFGDAANTADDVTGHPRAGAFLGCCRL